MLDRVLSAVVLCGAFLILTVVGGYAAPKTISKPMFNGNRLDWCLKWSTDCGKPAADAYCKAQGYQTAITYEPERRIGARTPTRLIGTGATCDLPYCDGFRQITCETTPIAKQVTLTKKPAIDAPLPLVRASYTPPLPQAKPAREVAKAAPATTITDTSAKTKEAAKAEVKEVAKPEVKEVAKAEVKEETPKPDPVVTGTVAAAPPLPAPKLFEKPMYNGERLDWCHAWDKDCGQIAADAFCKTNGFSRAKEFAQDPHIGDAQPTRVIANGAVCDQAVCNGFKAITCTM
jgi:hypothetical protein